MDSCIAFLKIGFKESFAYKSEVLMGIFGSVFAVIAQMALWKFVFSDDAEMTEYMISYVVISQLVRILYENHISYMIGEKVYTGDVAIDLIKPINPILNFWSTSFGMVLGRILNRGILLIAVFFPFLLKIKVSPVTLLQFVLACFLGYVIVSLVYMLVGYFSFVVIYIHPYVRLIE